MALLEPECVLELEPWFLLEEVELVPEPELEFVLEEPEFVLELVLSEELVLLLEDPELEFVLEDPEFVLVELVGSSAPFALTVNLTVVDVPSSVLIGIV